MGLYSGEAFIRGNTVHVHTLYTPTVLSRPWSECSAGSCSRDLSCSDACVAGEELLSLSLSCPLASVWWPPDCLQHSLCVCVWERERGRGRRKEERKWECVWVKVKERGQIGTVFTLIVVDRHIFLSTNCHSVYFIWNSTHTMYIVQLHVHVYTRYIHVHVLYTYCVYFNVVLSMHVHV